MRRLTTRSGRVVGGLVVDGRRKDDVREEEGVMEEGRRRKHTVIALAPHSVANLGINL